MRYAARSASSSPICRYTKDHTIIASRLWGPPSRNALYRRDPRGSRHDRLIITAASAGAVTTPPQSSKHLL